MTEQQPIIYLFYGPDGAGKTISMFKYSANRKDRKTKILLLSNDIYHIGSEDKLRKYSDIAGFDYWHISTETLKEKQEELQYYDEIFFDLFMKDGDISLNEFITSFGENFLIRKILVLNIFMLTHEKLIEYYSSKVGPGPDEYIITFTDYYPFFNRENQESVKERINLRAKGKTLWLSNGQGIPHDLYKYDPDKSGSIEYYSSPKGSRTINRILHEEKQWNNIIAPLLAPKEELYRTSLECPYPREYSSDTLAFGLMEEISEESLKEWGKKIHDLLQGRDAGSLVFQSVFMTTDSFLLTDYTQKLDIINHYLPEDIHVKQGWAGRKLPGEPGSGHVDWGLWVIKAYRE